jgi:membrane protease YdiL (CAAX protease family)
METGVRSMKSTAWLRLPAALLLALLVFVPAGMLSQRIGAQIPSDFAAKEWLSTSIFQFLMMIVAILFMLVIGRGHLRRFGFTRGSHLPLWPIVRAVLLVEVLTSLLSLAFSQEGPGHFAEDFTFLQIVVGVWLIASTCEEVVTRGLIQGYLEPLSRRGLRIAQAHFSVPVIAAAVVFSAMHVPLLVMGIDTFLGIRILLGAAAVGLIAGYYREQTGSLIPAIIAHMLANIFGMGIGALVDLFK